MGGSLSFTNTCKHRPMILHAFKSFLCMPSEHTSAESMQQLQSVAIICNQLKSHAITCNQLQSHAIS